MHTRKQEAWLSFVLLCVLTLACAIATVWRPNVFFISFLVVLVLGTIFGAYRVFFFSDDWYRAQEEKQQRWQARHPRFMALIIALGIGCILWQTVVLVRQLFR